MNRKTKIALTAVIIIFISCIAGTYAVGKPSENRVVEIVCNGTVIHTIDLETCENRDFVITSENGHVNTVTVKNGEIFVSYAECPDKTCVESGPLRSDILPIVCLPNKLIVRFK